MWFDYKQIQQKSMIKKLNKKKDNHIINYNIE